MIGQSILDRQKAELKAGTCSAKDFYGNDILSFSDFFNVAVEPVPDLQNYIDARQPLLIVGYEQSRHEHLNSWFHFMANDQAVLTRGADSFISDTPDHAQYVKSLITTEPYNMPLVVSAADGFPMAAREEIDRLGEMLERSFASARDDGPVVIEASPYTHYDDFKLPLPERRKDRPLWRERHDRKPGLR